MRIKYLKNSVASLSILSGLFCLTGCQDDGLVSLPIQTDPFPFDDIHP